jgi:hypothetical protein
LETDEVSHSTDREIDNQVHAPRVHLVNELLPIGDGSKVRVKQGEVDGGIT